MLRHLDVYLARFEERCTRAGGHVHWARDADEANRIIVDIIRGHGADEVIKVKTMTSDETRLNVALEAAGHHAVRDRPRRPHHPARRRPALAHRRSGAAPQPHRDPRASSSGRWGSASWADEPEDLAGAARQFLREKFLRVKVGFSGANFAVADTGIDLRRGVRRQRPDVRDAAARARSRSSASRRSIPSFADLEVFLQLLPRSATGERMNPYNSIWTGITAG